jgi:hypothetical protein
MFAGNLPNPSIKRDAALTRIAPYVKNVGHQYASDP